MGEQMKTIKKIKHIVAYEPKSFVDEVLSTVEAFEREEQEVEIQYSATIENYTALIIGRKVETDGTDRSSKAIRQTIQDKKQKNNNV